MAEPLPVLKTSNEAPAVELASPVDMLFCKTGRTDHATVKYGETRTEKTWPVKDDLPIFLHECRCLSTSARSHL